MNQFKIGSPVEYNIFYDFFFFFKHPTATLKHAYELAPTTVVLSIDFKLYV